MLGTVESQVKRGVWGGTGATTANVTAAGATQAAAATLTADVNYVTVPTATTADGVRLPKVAVGSVVMVRNVDAADALDLWPAVGDEINNLGADTAYTGCTAGKGVMCVGISSTRWSLFLTA